MSQAADTSFKRALIVFVIVFILPGAIWLYSVINPASSEGIGFPVFETMAVILVFFGALAGWALSGRKKRPGKSVDSQDKLT